MGPVPEENRNNPGARDLPNDSDSETLETPNDIIPPALHSSSDEDDDGYSDGEGPANDGYMLLPQQPEEEEGGGDEETFPSQAFPPLSALERDAVSQESMTEVRGAGVDVSQAVAEGNVHPAFAASFPDNKVPVHLQVPALPKAKKDDVLWNQTAPETDRLQLDSAQLCKVKSAMSGFQLPKANIPDWARHISDNELKQHLEDRLTSGTTSTSEPSSASGPDRVKKDVASIEHSEDAEKEK